MYISRLLTFALAALLAPVDAAPRTANIVHMNAAADSSYVWTVSRWAANYSSDDSQCSYAFNITGPYSGGQMPIPAFAAYCAGSGVGAAYALCHITDVRNTTRRRQVVARLQAPANATTASMANLAVSYRFDDLITQGTWWNYTSFATQPYNAPAQSGTSNLSTFTMKPSEVFGVA